MQFLPQAWQELGKRSAGRVPYNAMEAVRSWLPRGLGLAVFLWYLLLCAPGFFWLDSGELSAAAIALGVPHPTGFPLYMLMGKLASLMPFGELAFRINLLSALCAALAVAGVTRLILLLGQEDWATCFGALAGALTLAMCLHFARQATVAEVYAPTAAFIVLSLLLFERVARGGTARVGLSLAWVAGLGLALHPSYRLLMGLPILALFALRLYRGARWPLLAPAMTTLSAVGMYLYLPIRSASGSIAALDWGHASTLGKLWAHVNATEIRKVFADQMMSGTPEVVAHDVWVFADQIGDGLGLLALLAAAVGLVLLLVERRTRWPGCALASIIVLDVVYGFWLNPMGLVDLQNGVPLVLGLCVCAGVAVASLARSSGPAAPFVGAVASLALVIPPALVAVPAITAVGDLPRRTSEASLLATEAGAVLLTQSDSLAAGSIYLNLIEGARPDVAVLVLSMLADRKTVRNVLNASMPEERRLEALDAQPLASIVQTGRPLYWENGKLAAPAGSGLELGAMVSRIVPAGAARIDPGAAQSELRRIFAGSGWRDRSARRVLANALTNLGRFALVAGDMQAAARLFESAVETRPSHAAAWVNLGVLYSRHGNLKTAAETTERALQHEPNRTMALVNAARYRMLLDDDAAASRHAERALRVAPYDASSWNIAGLVDHRAGRMERARERLQRALELAPGYAEAAAALRAIGAGAAQSGTKR